ncbi:alanine racemase [bacterium]|nr:alanine racemase [bacterium]
MDTQAYSTWLEIDLDAIRDNVRAVKQMTGTNVMAVIKANGYGHGALQVAHAATEGGASWCGVARMEEALALRENGINSEIMVLGYAPPALVPEAIAKDIHVAIYDPDMARAYAEQARKAEGRLKAHLKIETGMGRLGMAPKKAAEFLSVYQNHDQIDVNGIFTHFARADEPQADLTALQLSRFTRLLDKLRQAGLCPPMVHSANSAAVLNYPEAYFDMVRPGIAIYGLNPSAESQLPEAFRPALTWKARLTSVRTLPPGHGVSYGSKYITTSNERIGVIPVGYGDGYRRVPGQQVLVRGRKVNIVGRVCMDQCMLQLDNVPDAVPSEEVVLLGQQGDARISADDMAATYKTINYEVVCGLADRLPRIYLNQ